MGAQSFIQRSKGNSVIDAYSKACKDAIDQYGNDTYNGTISTTGGVKDETAEWKRSKLSAYEYAEKRLEDTGKYHGAIGICERSPVINTNKIRSVVKNAPIKGTSKWELRYTVYCGMINETMLKSFATKTDAIKFARTYTESNKRTTYIRMNKVLVNQKPTVAEINYKPSTSEQDGMYILFGWASC